MGIVLRGLSALPKYVWCPQNTREGDARLAIRRSQHTSHTHIVPIRRWPTCWPTAGARRSLDHCNKQMMYHELARAEFVPRLFDMRVALSDR